MNNLTTTLVQELISNLLQVDGLLLVIDSSGSAGELTWTGAKTAEFKDGWATIEEEGWHAHVDMSRAQGVQFVEAADHGHTAFPKVYYARLSDAAGNTVIRFYFPNPWLDENEKPTEFQPERLKLFESYRDRYVGREGIEFVRRPS
jgi:hypothetical protein